MSTESSSFADDFDPIITSATGITREDLETLGSVLVARMEGLGEDFVARGYDTATIAIASVLTSLGYTPGLQA